MMNTPKIFTHEMFGELLVVTMDGVEHFAATEAARMLGYSNPHKAIKDHCREEGVNESLVPSNGGVQRKKFITEGNLYRLIARSKLPKAERFERWVFDEVLPTIRKHGAYLTPQKIEEALLNPDTLIILATNLKKEQELKEEERKKRLAAEQILEQQKPKVVYAEAVTVSEDTVLIKDLATTLKQQGLEIGEKRLFQWLRDNGYLCKQKGEKWNMPTQRSIDLGVIVVKHGLRTGSNGEMKKTRTPKITGKGQIYFINKFLTQKNVG